MLTLSPILGFRGELAALSAAFLWAVSTVVYGRLGGRLAPLVLNLAKGVIAIAFILLTLFLRGDFLPRLPGSALGLLLLSGAVGIGLGDTAYFAALNHLGARRALLMESLAPPLAAVLALLFLSEQLQLQAWMGILLTVLGVAWVITERVPITTQISTHPLSGVGFGMLAALGQASGAVLSRAALANTTIDPLWSALLRLVAGVLVLLVWIYGQKRSQQWFEPLGSMRIVGGVAIASCLGTYLAIWLQQISLKYAAAGIAQALSAISPLFVLPIAVWSGERVSLRAIAGVIIALGGVWLLLSQS
ncbi:MAG: DMT family transporter [Cyanothece sp. SIO1E1]|nr:DMT family transporter [Cyanothece sp. SIO1E1]